MTIVTVAERRAQELALLSAAVACVTDRLVGYAAAHGVRFVVFGSFARGDFDETSDLDLMIDGPPEQLGLARDFAETACGQSGLRYDVYLMSEISERLMARIRRDGRVVS